MHVHLLETAMAPRAGTCAPSSWTPRLTGVSRDRRGGDSCSRDGPGIGESGPGHPRCRVRVGQGNQLALANTARAAVT